MITTAVIIIFRNAFIIIYLRCGIGLCNVIIHLRLQLDGMVSLLVVDSRTEVA